MRNSATFWEFGEVRSRWVVSCWQDGPREHDRKPPAMAMVMGGVNKVCIQTYSLVFAKILVAGPSAGGRGLRICLGGFSQPPLAGFVTLYGI